VIEACKSFTMKDGLIDALVRRAIGARISQVCAHGGRECCYQKHFFAP
jgi:hypothetical protein